jgi:mRNA interferase MazF
VLRGDVHQFRLPKGIGREQHGDRYGIVLQADELLPRSVVIVAPTSRSARPASFRPEVDIVGETTRVLVEHIGAVDAQRLGDLVGHLAPEELWSVDDALITVLGLR